MNHVNVPGRCPACGTGINAGWKFCPHCSRMLAMADVSRNGFARTSDEEEEYVRLPGFEEMVNQTRRRHRRRRRPLYRRPKVVVPAVLLIIVVVVAVAGLVRASMVMSSLRAVSTPPPQITDATYMDEDDPALMGGPITVDTGPAQRAIAKADDRDLPQPQEGGIGGRWESLTGDVGDVVKAASMAAGADDAESGGFTMLIMGVDARPGAAIDIGVRPDVLMLVRFDPQERTCRMLSIPRDTRVDLPGYGKTKINHALMVGGIPYQLLVTEDFIDQPIDHYLLIDFVAFRTIVDTLGGVQVSIPEDLEKHGEIRYQAGTYDFDGEEALAYARFRTFSDDGDLSRVERQWSILASMARAASGRNLVADVNSLVPTLEDHLRTDLTLTEMTTITNDYGAGCLGADEDAVAKLEGPRVKFIDPILDKVDYYNVVSEGTVTERVNDLMGMGDEPGDAPAAPAGTIGEQADLLGARFAELVSTSVGDLRSKVS